MDGESSSIATPARSQRNFRPPAYLRNPHLQTLLGSIGPKRIRAARLAVNRRGESLELRADDGTVLLGEFDPAPAPRDAVAILLHGWEGSSRSAYQLTTAQRLLGLGFDVLRLNLRDHGDSLHLNRELFNSTRSPEVAGAIATFLDGRRYGRVCLGGFSLGGNFALRIAADRGAALGLDAVVAICPPVDPAAAMAALNCGWFVYERYFFRRWSRSLRRKLRHFPDLGYGEDLARAKRVDDLNRFFVPRHTPYPDVPSYFAAYALSGDRLAELRVPAHLIAAADDPIIPVADIARIAYNRHLHLDIQARGGHCGFVENLRGESWAERRLAAIFAAALG
jgi:predicted alpha/beta-fold hydrolase